MREGVNTGWIEVGLLRKDLQSFCAGCDLPCKKNTDKHEGKGWGQ